MKFRFLRFFLILILTTSLVTGTALVFADTADDQRRSATEALTDDGNFEEGSVEEELKNIADILVVVAMLVSAIKLAQIGYKFMLAPASKRSDAKASLLPWAVGVFICGTWLVVGDWVMGLITGAGLGDGGPFDI